ncbi:hypothetical protein ONS95_002366 [Cadophora gregata]|uniref:uncharacterized protein n=1 Tax=Cadophora gregata TaxID=51156 RepID=UPI0026DC034D|nr:uncharacterized protein ONS95_002366 [Cadophora gregata]KAK0109687.1 hypothetical protein ONS95_002366 [Cadophora gregata]
MKVFNLALQEGRSDDREQLTKRKYPSAKDNEEWGLPPLDSPEWDSLIRFFGREWFGRVWIVQEVRVASNAIALIGDYEISWMIVYIESSWFATKNYKHLSAGNGHIGIVAWANRIGCHKLDRNASFRVPLSRIIRQMRPSKSTDPRDKIFALLGMAEESENCDDPRLKPYYSKSLEHTYRDISRLLIDHERSLQILSAVGWVPDPRSPLNWRQTNNETEFGTETLSSIEWGPPDESVIFPSWVPRWDCPTIALPLVDRRDHEVFFHASGDYPLGLSPSADANTLIVKGLEIDVVARTSDVEFSKYIGYESHQTAIDRAWQEMGDRAAIYPEEYRLDVFHMTLTAGLMLNQKEAEGDANYRENVKAFRERIPRYNKAQDESHTKVPDDDDTKVPNIDVDPRLVDTSEDNELLIDTASDPDVYLRLVEGYCSERQLFITRQGYLGLGPKGIRPEDTVCILFGGDTPYILRKKDTCWKFVGECYVYGLMKGEAVRDFMGDGDTFMIL